MRKEFSPLRTLMALIVFGVIAGYPYYRSLSQNRVFSFSGMTMGTFYSVKIANEDLPRDKKASLMRDVGALLKSVNSMMSTYDELSELSRFNAAGKVKCFKVSKELAEVMQFSLSLAEHSDGAFDPTAGPLIDLWGFGTVKSDHIMPTAAKIKAAKKNTGFKYVSVCNEGFLRKKKPGVKVDLSAVAKGFGVDMVADLLINKGYTNMLVEIGGEIVAHGDSPRGRPWRIAVESPRYDAEYTRELYRVLLLSGKAVATSGDYRNYFKDGGEVYSHILDPRTGRSLDNDIASVSVVADDCMTADALATALMVLGVEDGLILLEDYPGVEAMFIIRKSPGMFTESFSGKFHEYISTIKSGKR